MIALMITIAAAMAAPEDGKAGKRIPGEHKNPVYATQGINELGGSMAFSFSPTVTSFSADPSYGYFVLDNVEMSLILGYQHLNIEDSDATNRLSAIVEPSVHGPFGDSDIFWALGTGFGVAGTDSLSDDGSWQAGWVLAPRGGLQFLVGQSGMLNLGVRYSIVVSNVDADVNITGGQAVVNFTNTFDVQTGFTVMFGFRTFGRPTTLQFRGGCGATVQHPHTVLHRLRSSTESSPHQEVYVDSGNPGCGHVARHDGRARRARNCWGLRRSPGEVHQRGGAEPP